MNQKPYGSARRSEPVPHGFRHRQHRFLAVQRLADDAGEKAGRGQVGLARAHADGRQPYADAVEESAAAAVGKQQLADRLLRAVAGERRAEELVADRLRKRRAKHRDGRSEDQARLIAILYFSNGFEKAPRAVEIDAVALLEIGFRFAGDDGGEVKDEVGAPGEQY